MRGTGSGTITIASIPPGATVTQAFLYWATVATTFSPPFANGVFNGTPITGTSTGTDGDPCWPGTTTTFAFRANVTALVLPGGNGAYTLTYDALDRVTTQKDPSGQLLTYTLDAVGNVQVVQDSQGGPPPRLTMPPTA